MRMVTAMLQMLPARAGSSAPKYLAHRSSGMAKAVPDARDMPTTPEPLEAPGGEHHQQGGDNHDEQGQLQGNLVAQGFHVQVRDLGQRQDRDADGPEGSGDR